LNNPQGYGSGICDEQVPEPLLFWGRATVRQVAFFSAREALVKQRKKGVHNGNPS